MQGDHKSDQKRCHKVSYRKFIGSLLDNIPCIPDSLDDDVRSDDQEKIGKKKQSDLDLPGLDVHDPGKNT